MPRGASALGQVHLAVPRREWVTPVEQPARQPGIQVFSSSKSSFASERELAATTMSCPPAARVNPSAFNLLRASRMGVRDTPSVSDCSASARTVPGSGSHSKMSSRRASKPVDLHAWPLLDPCVANAYHLMGLVEARLRLLWFLHRTVSCST